ncbi:hypothetical protein PR202_gb20609 [Eleusine coracana subsp. coracana]|uniref:RNA-directed RNA polymerase n=1 Tax=Eleusine coracana subsp. coracana TaxID=191504 RepID=A0AAV5FCZ6_ELECO|nr:hypothetical protein PR202_gb20609 [Eleusine coracana subsp. coracana]
MLWTSPGPPLPAAVSAELARLEARLGQAADPWARSLLAELHEAAAAEVIRRIAEPPRPVWNLSAYIRWMVDKDTMKRNAEGVPTAESAACISGPFRASQRDDSVSGPFYQDDAQMEVQSPNTEMSFNLSNQARMEPVSPVRQTPCRFQYHDMEVESPPCSISPRLPNQSPFSKVASPMAIRGGTEAVSLKHQMPATCTRDFAPSPVRDITKRVRQMSGPSGRGLAPPPFIATRNDLRAKASPQMLALGELEFDRFFLIRVYLGDKKIEEELKDVNYIRYLKSLPMDRFESAIWNEFGNKSIPETDRRKNLDWDTSKTRLYHCNIEKKDDSIVTTFKGPFMENTRTHLQKCLGDDNVLIVKFTDIPGQMNCTDKFGIYCTYYNQVSEVLTVINIDMITKTHHTELKMDVHVVVQGSKRLMNDNGKPCNLS